MTIAPQPMQVTVPGHLFGQLPFYDVVDTDDTVIPDLHNRGILVNILGALQGGLARHRLAARATLTFAVMAQRDPAQPATAP